MEEGRLDWREEGKARIIMGDGGRKAGLHSANNKEKQNMLMIYKTRKNMNLITNHIIKRYTETYLPWAWVFIV